MNENELKPCPFCGGEPKTCRSEGGAYVECKICGNRSVEVPLSEDYAAKMEAIEAWNRRTYPKIPQAYWTRHDLTSFDGKTIKHGAAICSFCGIKLFMPKDDFAYCPNCGAEMCNPQKAKRSKT